MAYTPQPIIPPWKGVVDNVPGIMAPSSSFKTSIGFWIDKQRLRTVPNRSALPVWTPDSGPMIGVRTFTDVVGNVHTVVITATQAYYYVNGVYTAIAATTPSSLTPVQTEVYQNVLIYTNGSGAPNTIDGSAVSGTIALPTAGTCYFLGKIASRMLYLNLIEPGPTQPGSEDNPRRFRWSKINDANNFSDFTAGVADIPEIEDSISGYATQGALGYIYRTKGITVITPTGGTSPTFFLENYQSGKEGVGNYYPYSLSQYGNLTVFGAEDDMYAFNPLMGPPQAIGGSAARSIYADLQAASNAPVGAMLPTLGGDKQGLQYWLAIPKSPILTVIWMYSFEAQTWMQQAFPFAVTTIGLVALA